MPRYKHYDYDQSLLLPVNFSEQIIPGTLEYTIHYLVEEKIDITPLEERFCNEETGAPAYDPKILLKIVLLAYSRGIISSRRIERLCRENIIFKAITAGTEPDFTTIANFIRSMQSEVKLIFSDVLLYCSELDLLGGTTFALDGCKMRSNASKENSGTFSDLEKKKEKLGKTLKLIMKQHRENDLKDKDERKQQKARIKKTKRKIEKIDRFLAENKPKANRRQGEKQSNITDNESAKMKTSKGVIQGYNGMAFADSKHQVIIAAEAFGNGQEQELLKPLMNTAKENALKAGMGKQYFKGKQVIADTGSFSEENLKYLSGEKIDAYIPDQQFRKRDPRFKGRERHKPEKEERYKAKDFTFNKTKDILICPNGKELRHEYNQEWRKTAGRIYRSRKADCKNCRLKNNCLKSEKTGQRSIYLVDSYFGRNYSEEMIKKIDTELGRNIYSRRMGIIEPVFAHICSAKGLDRFTLRTRAKVNIQWVLYCMVHNMEKICRYGIVTV